MKILIVDDERPARLKLRRFLVDEGEQDIGEAEDGVEAVAMVERDRPDLVFLDIQMPRMTGIELVRAVGVEAMPTLVFVTAYEQHALDAFDLAAVDYLLKPYDRERFRRAWERAKERILAKRDQRDSYQRVLDQLRRSEGYLRRFIVRQGPKFVHVPTSEVMYINADQKYMELHAEKGTYLVRETMGSLEESLDPAIFARIHRSILLNVSYLKEVRPCFHGDGTVILKNGEELALSRRYRDRLLH